MELARPKITMIKTPQTQNQRSRRLEVVRRPDLKRGMGGSRDFKTQRIYRVKNSNNDNDNDDDMTP